MPRGVEQVQTGREEEDLYRLSGMPAYWVILVWMSRLLCLGEENKVVA